MSFAGSLFLTGVGGLMYKWDKNQEYQPYTETSVPTKEYYDKVYLKKIRAIYSRGRVLISNFFPGFFNLYAFSCPLKGFREILINLPLYSVTVLTVLFYYLVAFALTVFVYWASITPMYLVAFGFLGPIGVAISVIHSVLQVNIFVLLYLRMNSSLDSLTLKYLARAKKYISYDRLPVKYYAPVRSRYFWFYHIEMKIAEYFGGLLVFLGLLSVSFIPILGPILFHLLISPIITRIYVSKYLRLRGISNIERYELVFQKFGAYTIFGLPCGILESIPIFSAFALCSNTISAVIWSVNTEKTL